jgi:tRNA nucleotidyltransferase (CCA-adding enzyme)
MEVYVCGGAVRDVLIGIKPKDIDYVVVGATPEDMVAHNFTQVGIDFPVFLHPKTGDEYALARVERKTGVGYTEFHCNTNGITLEEDLSRRDLTMNGMAVHIDDWETFVETGSTCLLIDPFHGYDDIISRTIRHIGPAFSEDPIRVLRAARFSGRYGFDICAHTKVLMADVVQELNTISTDRIWTEFQKGLGEQYAYRMIEVLEQVGAFDVDIMCPFKQEQEVDLFNGNDRVLSMKYSPVNIPVRFAIMGQHFDETTFKSHRIPNDCVKLTMAVQKHGTTLVKFDEQPKEVRLNIIEQLRAVNSSEFVDTVFTTLMVMSGNSLEGPRHQFARDVNVIRHIGSDGTIEQIIADTPKGSDIKQKIKEARLAVMD